MQTRHGRVKANRPLRVKWLAEHPHLWNKSKKDIVREMKSQGLIAATTHWKDVDIDTMIAMAKSKE